MNDAPRRAPPWSEQQSLQSPATGSYASPDLLRNLLLVSRAKHRLVDLVAFRAGVLEELGTCRISGHCRELHLPRTRENSRILDRDLIVDRVLVHWRVPLDDVHRRAVQG